MQTNQLRPAKDFANQYGVKGLIYGPPGSAKTPVINSCPRPVLLACEPGLLSMRNSMVPTWQAHTPALIDEFFKWLFFSNETKQFDTVAVDSVSQMADIYLQAALSGTSKSGNKMHGMAAYGEMARNVMDHLRPLYYLQQKHAYLICKEQSFEENGFKGRRPFFPGQQLPVEVPHLYDEILHLMKRNVPGVVGETLAFRCHQSIDIMARDRTGSLAEYEPPDYGKIIIKCMG